MEETSNYKDNGGEKAGGGIYKWDNSKNRVDKQIRNIGKRHRRNSRQVSTLTLKRAVSLWMFGAASSGKPRRPVFLVSLSQTTIPQVAVGGINRTALWHQGSHLWSEACSSWSQDGCWMASTNWKVVGEKRVGNKGEPSNQLSSTARKPWAVLKGEESGKTGGCWVH